MTNRQTSARPVIGITADRDGPDTGAESTYFIRRNYCRAVSDAGGIPLVLPYAEELVADYINLIEGLLIPGGGFDISPHYYNEPSDDALKLKPDRTAFEHAMVSRALELAMPTLGVCGGMQLLAVVAGGNLIHDISAEVDTPIAHSQPAQRCMAPQHWIQVENKSRLRDILGSDRVEVNSSHHQSVKSVPPNLRISATADDGVIEAIEQTDQPFCLGIQWHPEYRHGNDAGIFEAFRDAANDFRLARRGG